MKGSREEKYPASCYLQFSRTAAVTKTKKEWSNKLCINLWFKYFRKFLWITKERSVLNPNSNLPIPFLLLPKTKYLDDNFRIQVFRPFQICKGYHSNPVLTFSHHCFHQDSLVPWRYFQVNLPASTHSNHSFKITANPSFPDPWILNYCYPENTNWW